MEDGGHRGGADYWWGPHTAQEDFGFGTLNNKG